MTQAARHILCATAACTLIATSSYGSAAALEGAVRACLTERGEVVDWPVALGDWDTVRLGKSPNEGFTWALTMDDLQNSVVGYGYDTAKITAFALEFFPKSERVLRSDFREDYWERFDHGSGWHLGIFYNPGGYTQCLMWNQASRIDDYAFMRGEVTGDLLWDAFVNTPNQSGMWRSFGASYGAGPQANVAAVTFTGLVLEDKVLPEAPRSMMMLKAYHYVEEE